jgi:hypothetical protein
MLARVKPAGMPETVIASYKGVSGLLSWKPTPLALLFVKHFVVGTVPDPVADKVLEFPAQIVAGLAKAGDVNVGAGLTIIEAVVEFLQPLPSV